MARPRRGRGAAAPDRERRVVRGTVADCLAAGAVLVVTGIGAGRDLPDDGGGAASSPTVSAGELATRGRPICSTIPSGRAALAAAGRDVRGRAQLRERGRSACSKT